MKIWKLKKGHDSRLRARHPWVFSNELFDSPKSIKPGEAVELQDYNGHFLARGYGNPHSLIAFRAMTFDSKVNNPTSVEFVISALWKAWVYRDRCGFKKSFRLCFSEVDSLPGIIIDRYVILKNNIEYQVFSYQLLTAGMDTVFRTNLQWQIILRELVKISCDQQISAIDWEHTLVLEKNDVNIRKLEGLQVEKPQVLKTIDDEDLTQVEIVIQNVLQADNLITFQVNLIDGQKTGFFLDQTFNMKLLLEQFSSQRARFTNKKVRILDLCCYMGQWSSQIVNNLKLWGIEAEVHLVDVSELALQKASLNLQNYRDEKYQLEIFTYKKDVLEFASLFEDEKKTFDIVISDPPAFVKNKKDIHQGLHAYFKLNSQAFSVCASGALVVSCTCSGGVPLEDFKESLRKAVLRSGKEARCVTFGSQGWDHPTQMSFPEGYYLKMVMHQMS